MVTFQFLTTWRYPCPWSVLTCLKLLIANLNSTKHAEQYNHAKKKKRLKVLPLGLNGMRRREIPTNKEEAQRNVRELEYSVRVNWETLVFVHGQLKMYTRRMN